MNAIEKMIAECQSYLDSIKVTCSDKSWDDDYNSRDFIEQCFDEIQDDVMREFHGINYYDSAYEPGQCGDDYEQICDIRGDFTDEAYSYVQEKFDEVRPDLWSI